MLINERGRPGLDDMETIKKRIVDLLEEMTVAHPERLRKAYNDHFREDRKLAWITLRKYLDQLKNEGKIREQVITQGKRRTISVLRLNF